jgi:iron complex transport system ATP-binding protein
MSTLVEVVKSNDISAIMTVHDINLALRYADKFIMLKNGTIFAAGDHTVINPENIEAVYNLPVNVANFMGRPIIVPL